MKKYVHERNLADVFEDISNTASMAGYAKDGAVGEYLVKLERLVVEAFTFAKPQNVLTIFNRDTTVTHVVPLKLWTPEE